MGRTVSGSWWHSQKATCFSRDWATPTGFQTAASIPGQCTQLQSSLIAPAMHTFTSCLCSDAFFFPLKPLYYWSMNNYVINVYSLINLEIGIHPWNHHYNLYHKHIYHLQKFLLLTLIIVIIKSLNIRPTLSKFLSTLSIFSCSLYVVQ